VYARLVLYQVQEVENVWSCAWPLPDATPAAVRNSVNVVARRTAELLMVAAQ
jgi:hypothetical protein